jgi:hypothetical protein
LFQPYGVNQAGPYVSYTMTDNDGKLKTGAGEYPIPVSLENMKRK